MTKRLVVADSPALVADFCWPADEITVVRCMAK